MEEVIEVFKKLNIDYTLVKHPAIFCEADEYLVEGIDFHGIKCKNLFLRDKAKHNYYLVSLPVEKRADLKKISEELGSSRLSFGNEKELWDKLHIKPGSVSILNVIGAPDTDVTFVLDKELVGAGNVSFHPNDNTASIAFDSDSIKTIMDEYNKTLLYLEVEGK